MSTRAWRIHAGWARGGPTGDRGAGSSREAAADFGEEAAGAGEGAAWAWAVRGVLD